MRVERLASLELRAEHAEEPFAGRHEDAGALRGDDGAGRGACGSGRGLCAQDLEQLAAVLRERARPRLQAAHVIVERAPGPQGQWVHVADYPVPVACTGDRCVNYGTFVLPWLDDAGRLIVVVGNNTWDMRSGSYLDPSKYHPSVWAVPLPV